MSTPTTDNVSEILGRFFGEDAQFGETTGFSETGGFYQLDGREGEFVVRPMKEEMKEEYGEIYRGDSVFEAAVAMTKAPGE